MKRFFFLLSLLICLTFSVNALFAGNQNVLWTISGVNTSASGGKDVNTTLKTSSIDPTSETGVWTAVASSSYASSSSGAQFGSGSYTFAGTISLSGTSIPSTATIKTITINCTSSGSAYKVNATVDGQAFGSQVTLSDNGSKVSTAKDFSFTGSQLLGENGSIVLTFSSGGKKNVVIKSILVTYTPAGGATLQSIAVSGAPTKTSYYAGQNFNPAGLTVTGTYSDASTAPITSDITWAYNPSQTLTLNQTSIKVTATVDEIESAEYNVTGLTVSAPVNYEKVTATPSDWSGEYLLVYESGSNAYVYTGVDANNNCVTATISNDVIAIPDGAAKLTIASMDGGYSIRLSGGTNDGKYISGTSGTNTTKFTADPVANTLSIDNGSAVITAGNTIRFNSGSATLRFRYYGATAQQPVQLYKKVDGTVKPSAELSYAAADQKKLTKLGETFTAPTLVNPHGVAVTYASSAESVAEVAANGAVTIKAAGVATITASFAGNDDYKEGSASYTIGVTTKAGTQADPYVAADAKIAIDVMGTVENAYATGIVSNITTTTLPQEGYITFYFSADGLTSGQQIEAYKCYGLNSAPFEALADVKTGATVVVTGTLKKYNSTYEFDQNCHLVSYEAPAVPKTHIANDQANPYTVAQAITYAADGVTYDLDDYVYVQGVVYDVKSFNSTNGTLDIYIKDANAENQFELFKCAGINDGTSTTAFTSLSDVQVGNVVIGYGQLTVHNTVSEFKQGNYIVDFQKPVTNVTMDATASVEVDKTVTLTATILPSNATNKSITWSVTSGSDKASVADGVVTGKAEGTAVIRATSAADNTKYAECTVTVTAASAPDTRNIANSPATFTETSGDLTPADITYAANQGGASTAPAIQNNGIRLYQISGSNTFGGFITLTAKLGCTIDEVQITTTSKYATTVAYSKDGNENLLGSESVEKSGSYTTGTGLNVSSVNILNLGTGSNGRLEIASIKVYYTGEAAAIDHYELGGTYATVFEVGDEFNHNGLIVYAAFDASGENKSDITSSCTFSTPDMSTEGDKTIEITYNDAVVKSYTITVNASTDTRKVANSPETFTAVSGDLTPADITFASYQGEAGTAPANYNDGIRLYQAPSADKIGGYITLKAKKGCTIDQVKITTTKTYATTVAYSVDGNENLLGSESVAKSSDYTTPSGLNVESVNIVNKGTGSNGRLEIASIKVWYTGDALPVHHYILGGTYETTFEQYGTFSYDGLTVTAAYDAGETITEAVTGFTVEADLSTAGAKKAEVMLNSVKIAEYDITVTESPKEDPALAYIPASVILTLGDALSAPTFSNTHNVSPISYNSDKPAVATVDAEGNIALAGGTGVAVITASFAGNDDYIESEATFTITVNEPAEDLSGTWVKATSVAAGDRIIVGATVSAGTKTMGKQNSNPNRAAVASTLADGVLTPGEGTKTFLVVDAGDGKFALQALNGKYLTSATSGTGNSLLEAENFDLDNAKWTITIDGEGVASVVAAAGSRTYMQYNNGSTLFSCYEKATSQSPINIYKKSAQPEPELTYEALRPGLEQGRFYSACVANNIIGVQGGILWDISYYEGSKVYFEEIVVSPIEPLAAGKPFICYTTSNDFKVAYGDQSVPAPVVDNNSALRGTFSLMTQSDFDAASTDNNGSAIYIISNNQLRQVAGREGNSLAANRAYLVFNKLTEGQPNPAPGRRVMTMTVGENVATDIDFCNGETINASKIIRNGQILIIRDGKTFDVTGREMK